MVETRKRHCWECFQRRLVCDYGIPGCRRCAKSGVDCPGYGETPPLRVKVVAPKTRSRQRKDAEGSRQLTRRASSKSASSESARSDSSRGSSVSSNDTKEVAAPRVELKTEYHALVQACEYFNTCMYPRLASILRLGPNISVYQISPVLFQMGIAKPDHTRLGLICMILSHRMIQTADDPASKALERTFYSYRGRMIRSLNEEISLAETWNSQVALVGILTLLLLDAQHGISQHWRYHFQGVQRLITLRGGMRQVAETTGVPPIILCYIYLVVIADISSPASELFTEKLQMDEVYTFLEEYGGNGHAFQLCPPPLLIEVIKINHIRARASRTVAGSIEEFNLQGEACEVLRSISSFPTEEWAAANGRVEHDSKLLLNILQSAVSLYCISSLRSLSVLPADKLLNNNCEMEARILYGLLSKALDPRSSFGARGYTFWPLLILGVQAGSDSDMRTFVTENMVKMSKTSGTHGPLAAKEVLEKFWASGKTGWDACFDKPYLLTTVLTVNRGRVTRNWKQTCMKTTNN